jgi:triosephosphate isomerase
MKYFVANWKANKNLTEVNYWINVFLKKYRPKNDIKVIICPPYPFLSFLSKKIKGYPNIFLGTQDISQFDNGPFTGEVTASMIADLVKYTIVGHSERRQYFLEDESIIEKKIKQAIKYKIEPILCIRNNQDKIFDEIKIVAYEPVFAIGSGNNEPPEQVFQFKNRLNLPNKVIFLYGGSVNEFNAKDYLKEGIDGLLIGTASLNPLQLLKIIG